MASRHRSSRSRVPGPLRRPETLGLGVVALVVVAAAVLLRVPGTAASFTRTVTTTTNRAQSWVQTCRTAVRGDTGSPATFALPLSETSAAAGAADVTGNGNTYTYSGTGVTYRQAGACPRDSPASIGITLDGSTGLLNNGGRAAVTPPQVFSLEVWFKTSYAQGKLLGWGSSVTGLSASYDRHLYVDSTGKLDFGVWPGSFHTLTTSAAVTDGLWHHVVATLSSAGQKLYLDGALVASNATWTSAEGVAGGWRIGYDNLNTWPNAPVSSYFRGSLSWVAVYPMALSAATVQEHYLAGR